MVAPLLLPIIQGLGFDPVWFAVIMTVNLEIGLVTPPVGLNLYVVKNIAPDIPMYQVLWGVITICDHRLPGDCHFVHLARLGTMAAEHDDRVDGGVNG